MSESANSWSGVVPAWVPLAELLDTVERELNVPRDRAVQALRRPLESYEIHTVVVGWNVIHAGRGGRFWVGLLSRQRNEYRVSQQGWEHVDWTNGKLGECEIKVFWQHVVRELAGLVLEDRIAATRQNAGRVEASGGPAPDSDSRIAEATAWMRGYAQAYREAGNKPKRDTTVKLCQDDLDVTYRIALAGWNALPDDWKNPPRTAKA